MVDLIDLLEGLQSAKSPIVEECSLTPAQISGTLYLTRLALARLYVIYSDTMAMSRNLFLQAIHSKWKIDEQRLNAVASVSHNLYIPVAR